MLKYIIRAWVDTDDEPILESEIWLEYMDPEEREIMSSQLKMALAYGANQDVHVEIEVIQ